MLGVFIDEQQVRLREQSLGGGGVMKGKELAATARAMTAAWESFEQGVDAIKGLSKGKLRVAVVSTAKYFMPRLVGRFCQHHPAIDVSLEILNRDGVVSRLRENLDDLYIMSMPPSDLDLMDEALMPNPIVMIAAQSDPLTRRAGLTLQDVVSRAISKELAKIYSARASKN